MVLNPSTNFVEFTEAHVDKNSKEEILIAQSNTRFELVPFSLRCSHAVPHLAGYHLGQMFPQHQSLSGNLRVQQSKCEVIHFSFGAHVCIRQSSK